MKVELNIGGLFDMLLHHGVITSCATAKYDDSNSELSIHEDQVGNSTIVQEMPKLMEFLSNIGVDTLRMKVLIKNSEGNVLDIDSEGNVI